MTTRTTYDTVVGYTAAGEAVILNDTFVYGDGFKGATGAILELVSQERYDEATSEDALREHLEDYWRELVASAGETRSLQEFVDDTIIEGGAEMVFDSSYWDLLPDDAPEHVTTHCISSGRIFPQALNDLVTVLRPDLVEVIRKIEA